MSPIMDVPKLTVVHEAYPFTEDFRRDWDRLYKNALGANVFTRLAWIEEGWKRFAPAEDIIRPLRFLDELGQTQAMAIHRETVRRKKWRTIISWRTLDYNVQRIVPILTKDTRHFIGAFVALYKAVAGRIDVFDFFKLDPLEGRLESLKDSLLQLGYQVKLNLFNEQPRICLPETWDTYYQSHSRIFWKTPRPYRRRLAEERGEITFQRLRYPQEFKDRSLEAALADMTSVYKKSWQYQTIDEDEAVTPQQMLDFYWGVARAIQPSGCLDLCLLYAGEQLVAFDLNLVDQNVVYMICGMYDMDLKNHSPGRILLIDELEDGVGRGDRIYEFGGEFIGYKEAWTKDKVPAYHLRIRGRTVAARLRGLLDKIR